MSIFVRPTDPAPVRHRQTRLTGIIFAVFLVVLAVAQLYSFESFAGSFQTFGLPYGERATYFLSAFTVVAEVFAVPFLLRMRLSPAFRVVSMVLGWIVAAIWLKLSLFLLITGRSEMNVGYLGDVVTIAAPAGLVIAIGLVLMAIGNGIGLWPLRRAARQ